MSNIAEDIIQCMAPRLIEIEQLRAKVEELTREIAALKAQIGPGPYNGTKS